MITKDYHWSGNFTQTEGFGRGREPVRWICCSRLNLTEELPVGQHGGGQILVSPVLLRRVKDLLIEDMIVSEVRVKPTHACVMLQDVVAVEMVSNIEVRIAIYFWSSHHTE